MNFSCINLRDAVNLPYGDTVIRCNSKICKVQGMGTNGNCLILSTSLYVQYIMFQ